MMSPDRVCKKYSKDKLNIKIYIEDDMVFIEGTTNALKFLGNLFLAQAAFKKDCGFQLSSTGSGYNFFDRKSDKGLYIHRIPCKENKNFK